MIEKIALVLIGVIVSLIVACIAIKVMELVGDKDPLPVMGPDQEDQFEIKPVIAMVTIGDEIIAAEVKGGNF